MFVFELLGVQSVYCDALRVVRYIVYQDDEAGPSVGDSFRAQEGSRVPGSPTQTLITPAVNMEPADELGTGPSTSRGASLVQVGSGFITSDVDYIVWLQYSCAVVSH